MFKIMSNGIYEGHILNEYGINSENVIQGVPQTSLPLKWSGAPLRTQSYAIVFQDYDNIPDEGFSWIHWLLADIHKDITNLDKNASREGGKFVQGTNSWAIPYGPYVDINEDLTLHYGGPAPEREHEYEIKIYALDKILDMKKGFYYNQLLKSMEGHILAESILKGCYGK
ncbi:MAG: YbhB/YbcL family Raf kinase inhibitor-like protein [Peptostreptococcaceae bacterium]|nr:YbhB/YbcL family Raf kinase inhibitor-like protein [Peptostreptococcaceae bacterium]